jgi:acyl carrier protein
MGSVEDEVKQLIIDVLQLEDITPADIDTDAPLFVDGLGLDSIDALELGVALHKWSDPAAGGRPQQPVKT